MSRPAEALADPYIPVLTAFEESFIRTVLEHRGVFHRPTLVEFRSALDALRRYDEQCQDNPGLLESWAPRISTDDLACLRAKAFLMYGVTKPSRVQWHKAHAALFGPLLCETCG
jgi:hypothetical protein